MSKIEKIFEQTEGLSTDERLALAYRLLASCETGSSEDAQKAWDLEIRERMARYDRGETAARPAKEFLDDLDRGSGM